MEGAGAAAITVERPASVGGRVARAIGAVVSGTRLFLIARAAALGMTHQRPRIEPFKNPMETIPAPQVAAASWGP